MSDYPKPTGTAGKVWLVILGVVIIAAALFFIGGGAWLITLGGSWYFLPAGIVLFFSGLNIIRGRALGALLFGLVLVATALWSLWEVGLEFWPLVLRLFAMAVGGVVVALSVPLLTRERGPRLAGYGAALVLVAAVVATAIGAFSPKNVIAPTAAIAAATPVDRSAPLPD